MTALTIILCAAVIGFAVIAISYREGMLSRDRIIAVKVAEATILSGRAKAYSDALTHAHNELDVVNANAARAANELAETRARLAPFIAERERDPVTKRFLPAVRSEAA